ncbi:AraC family transcriptional regulator [Sinorhizobium garamanticum]|uniref:AraC family transcriptional regulator n=1 Tax=Sinorhizobium garamanticum TaxID=680247 RepID=A0ABY8D4N1_9HYPH|nr:AraC family transcriptional regulator [Sinorhizobium garamanticum]WEX85804.1 AraC family transcriptional regulator [Sinorhizobium garamanticum]
MGRTDQHSTLDPNGNNGAGRQLAVIGATGEYSRAETSLHVHPDVTVVKSSEGFGWSDLYAAVTDERPHLAIRRAIPDIWFASTLTGIELRRTVGEEQHHAVLSSDLVTITPAGMAVRDEIAVPVNAVHVFLRGDLMQEVADDLFARHRSDRAIIPAFAIEDRALYFLLHAIRVSLDDPPRSNLLKAEFLSRAMAAHVLQIHSTDGVVRNRVPDRLGSNQFRAVVDYIEANLSSEISVNELAAITGLSREQFFRRFRASLGMTPYRYVMMVRIEQAKAYLADPKLEIVSIALMCGFSNQSHFGAVFRRFTGKSPAGYRRSIA